MRSERPRACGECRARPGRPGSGCPCPHRRLPRACAIHLAEPAERAHRALLGNEEARIDLRCRIVHGHDQVPPRARNPLVARAVLVQHHPHHRAARPLPAVRPAPGRRLDLAVRLQAQAKPVVAQPEAMLADQLRVEVLGREVRVARLDLSPCNCSVRRIRFLQIWRKSKTGQIICYIDRSYRVLATPSAWQRHELCVREREGCLLPVLCFCGWPPIPPRAREASFDGAVH